MSISPSANRARVAQLQERESRRSKKTVSLTRCGRRAIFVEGKHAPIVPMPESRGDVALFV